MNRARHGPCPRLGSAESGGLQACGNGVKQAGTRTASTEGEMMALDMMVIVDRGADVILKGKIKNPVYRSALSYASKCERDVIWGMSEPSLPWESTPRSRSENNARMLSAIAARCMLPSSQASKLPGSR